MSKVYFLHRTFALLCFFLSVSAHGQNIRHFLQLLPQRAQLKGDHFSLDSVIDVQHGYASYKNRFPHGGSELILEAACFTTNGAPLIVVTTYGGDQQCTFYHTYFYRYDKRTDSLVSVNDGQVLPELPLDLFLDRKKAERIIAGYLPEIKRSYLGPDADAADVLREIYSFHFIVPEKGTALKATLQICDYIQTNHVAFSADDQAFLERVKTISLRFNKPKGRFEL